MLNPFAQTVLEVDVAAPWRRGLLLLACAVPSLLLSFYALRWAYAERLGDTNELKLLQRAVVLDPRNPQFYDKLGRIALYSNDAPPTPGPVEYFRKAVELAPRDADYWADLASACDWKGDTPCSQRALDEARRLAPLAPRFGWFAANHYVRANQPERALPHLRRLLQMSTDYGSSTFDLCAHAFGNTDKVLSDVLTPQSDLVLKLAFLDYEASHDRLDTAARVWSDISSAHATIPLARVEFYFQKLLATGDVDQAGRVWSDLQRLAVVPPNVPGNLIFNGKFDHVPLNAGFDWQPVKLPYVQADFHNFSGPAGAHAVRLDFIVPRNDDAEPLLQFVPVRPSTAYLLTAHVRSVMITSDSGPRLRVLDAEELSGAAAQTEGAVGTTPWHEVSTRFTTGSDTRLLRVSVWRPRSRSFPPNIAGSFWLSDVVLREEGAQNQTKRD